MQTKTKPVPFVQLPADYPHDSCDWPSDVIHAHNGPKIAEAMVRRKHTADYTDPNNITIKHGVLPVKVKYFRTTDDRPYQITDRARILRALKLFAFFVFLAAVIWHQQIITIWQKLEAFAESHIL